MTTEIRIPVSEIQVGDVTNLGTVIDIGRSRGQAITFVTNSPSQHTDDDGETWYTEPTTSFFCPNPQTIIRLTRSAT